VAPGRLTRTDARTDARHAIANGYPSGLPIRWHLGEGLVLPDDLDKLRTEVEREGQVLVLLDSLYSFLRPGIGLRDEEVDQLVLAPLATEICEGTEATVLVLDHKAWPTESNRGQHRAFGSVFKAARFRFSLSLEKRGGKFALFVGGNDLEPAKLDLVLDWSRLAFEPLDAEQDLEAAVVSNLNNRRNGAWLTVEDIAVARLGGVGKRQADVRPVLERLAASGAIECQLGPPGRARDARGLPCGRPGPGTTPDDRR
jgi:hypothetical protein